MAGSRVGFICVGDRTSHGGVVLTGDAQRLIMGRPTARIGDDVSYPMCKRTSKIISSRFPCTQDGPRYAFDQDVTDCGAILYSSNNGFSGWVEDALDAPPASIVSPSELPEFQEHFEFAAPDGAPQADVNYRITNSEGKTYTGKTDAQGRTAVAWTDASVTLRVELEPDDSAKADDPYHYPSSDSF